MRVAFIAGAVLLLAWTGVCNPALAEEPGAQVAIEEFEFDRTDRGCYDATPQFWVTDMTGGLPVQQGDTLHFQGADAKPTHSVWAVDVCYYRGGVLVGARTLGPGEHDIRIEPTQAYVIFGDIHSFDFAGYGACDELSFTVYTVVLVPYNWMNYDPITADGPTPVPATGPVGLALLILGMGGLILGVKRKR